MCYERPCGPVPQNGYASPALRIDALSVSTYLIFRSNHARRCRQIGNSEPLDYQVIIKRKSADPYLAGRLRKSITSQLRGQTGNLGEARILAVTITRLQSEPQTVRKVLARLKYPVPLCKARSGFSILTEECLTFRTISPVIGPPKTKRRALPCRPGSSCKLLSGVSCPAYLRSHCRIHTAKR